MDNKLNIFNELTENYFLVIKSLMELAKDKNIIPSFASRGHQAEVYDYAYPEKNVFKYFY